MEKCEKREMLTSVTCLSHTNASLHMLDKHVPSQPHKSSTTHLLVTLKLTRHLHQVLAATQPYQAQTQPDAAPARMVSYKSSCNHLDHSIGQLVIKQQ